MAKDRNELGYFVQGHKVNKITKNKLDWLIEEYCKHRAQGNEKHTFSLCDYRTLEKNASIVQAEKIREAEAKGYAWWETVLKSKVLGRPLKLQNNEQIEAENIDLVGLIFVCKNKQRAVEQREAKEKEGPKEQGGKSSQSTPFTIINPEDNTTELDLSNIGAADEETT